MAAIVQKYRTAIFTSNNSRLYFSKNPKNCEWLALVQRAVISMKKPWGLYKTLTTVSTELKNIEQSFLFA